MEKLFASLNTYCVPQNNITFDFCQKGFGFGQISFYWVSTGEVNEYDEPVKKLMCGNECMSKEKVKQLFELVVDIAEFDS